MAELITYYNLKPATVLYFTDTFIIQMDQFFFNENEFLTLVFNEINFILTVCIFYGLFNIINFSHKNRFRVIFITQTLIILI